MQMGGHNSEMLQIACKVFFWGGNEGVPYHWGGGGGLPNREPGTNIYIYIYIHTPIIPNSLRAHIPEKWGSAMNSWGALSKERDYSGSSSSVSWSKTHVWYRLSRLQCRCGPRSLANTLTTGAPTRGQRDLTLELMILGFHWIPLDSIGFHYIGFHGFSWNLS